MKKYLKTIITSLIIIIAFTCGMVFTKEEENSTIKNKKNEVALTKQPRLEDDFYDYINYDEKKINELEKTIAKLDIINKMIDGIDTIYYFFGRKLQKNGKGTVEKWKKIVKMKII